MTLTHVPFSLAQHEASKDKDKTLKKKYPDLFRQPKARAEVEDSSGTKVVLSLADTWLELVYGIANLPGPHMDAVRASLMLDTSTEGPATPPSTATPSPTTEGTVEISADDARRIVAEHVRRAQEAPEHRNKRDRDMANQ